MPAPTRRTPARDTRFLAALAHGHAVETAARAAGYAPASVYRWRATDQAFAARWLDVQVKAVDRFEAEADARARDGVDEPVVRRGKRVGLRRRFSDGLLLARLKALRPESYRDPPPAAAAQPGGGAPTVVIREFEMEAELLRLVRERKLARADLSATARARLEALEAREASHMRDVSQMRDTRG